MADRRSTAQRRVRRIRSRRRRAALLRALVVVGLLAGAAGIHRLLTRGLSLPAPPTAPAPTPAPAPARPEPLAPLREPSAAPRPAELLPALDASDATIREAVRGLSPRGALAAWTGGGDLIRRFVAAVDNVAAGNSPRRQIPEAAPRGPFRARTGGGAVVIDPASYARYDAHAAVLASLDSAACVAFYARFAALFQEAYADLGHPDSDFDAALVEAIDELLRAPVVDGPVELLPGIASYELRDPALEALPPAQKHLLRMGPDNTRRIQGKLRELREALEARREGLR